MATNDEQQSQQTIQQVQMLEQSLQSYQNQRQNVQVQLVEIESALTELENTEEAYNIIGNIMVLSDPEKLKKNLQEKKESAEIRIKSIEKQEKQIKEKMNNLQQEVVQSMKNKSSEQ